MCLIFLVILPLALLGMHMVRLGILLVMIIYLLLFYFAVVLVSFLFICLPFLLTFKINSAFLFLCYFFPH